MNCRKIMTSNPATCTPADTVAKAAKLMRSEDVGPIPVVTHDNTLVGIVTDRDLTLKVLAEGRDPQTTLVESVMTANPVACREDQDVKDALRAMSSHQIRRIPIVDYQHRLTGIIAQADVARQMHDETVGAVVEDISEPRGLLGWLGGGHEPTEPRSAAKSAAMAMSLGAGLMYLLDPNRGSERRAYIKDQASAISAKTKHAVDVAGEGLRKTREGARSLFEHRDMAEGESGVPSTMNGDRAMQLLKNPSVQYAAAGIGGGLALYGLLRGSRFARTAAATAGVAMVARSLQKRRHSPTTV